MHRTIIFVLLLMWCLSPHSEEITVRALEFQQTAIYHSPQTPGYTAWCTLWQQGGLLKLAFQQVTGPVADPSARKNVTVILTSADKGKTWGQQREVLARAGTTDDHGIYASPGSSSFCGHGMAKTPEGTLITGLWPGGDRKSGYMQQSTDGGKTWSDPIYPLDPAVYKIYPTELRCLRDGRIILVAGVVKQADAQRQKFLNKEFFGSSDGGKTWSLIWAMPPEVGACEESDFVELDAGELLFVHRAEHYQGDQYLSSDRLQNLFYPKADGSWQIGPVQKIPIPHSGFPQLLKTREGLVLHIATNGVHWTADAGGHWTKLDLSGSPYYPEAVQLDDGRIVVVGHVGSDNVYGSVDQTIVQQSFKLIVQHK